MHKTPPDKRFVYQGTVNLSLYADNNAFAGNFASSQE